MLNIQLFSNFQKQHDRPSQRVTLLVKRTFSNLAPKGSKMERRMDYPNYYPKAHQEMAAMDIENIYSRIMFHETKFSLCGYSNFEVKLNFFSRDVSLLK